MGPARQSADRVIQPAGPPPARDCAAPAMPGLATPAAVAALQRAAGNRATAALLQRRPYDEPDFMTAGRVPWYRPPAPSPAAATAPDPLEPAALAHALATTGKKNRRVTSTGMFAAYWDAISSGITAKPRNGKLPQSNFEALRTAPVSAALLGLSDDARAALAEQVGSALLSEVTGGKLTLPIIDGELAEIGPTATLWSGGRLGWLSVRDGVYDAFGTLGMARRYYEGKIHAHAFFGKTAMVHDELGAALDRGAAKFQAIGGKPEEIHLTTFGGLNIRANTNNPRELSEHSFGAAVDIDGMTVSAGAGVAAGNPNLQESRLAALGIPSFWGFVKELTGSDAFQRTDKGKKVKNSATGTYEQNLAEAKRLQQMSEKLRGIFASPDAVKRAMREVLGHYAVSVPAGGDDRLLAAALAAAAAFDGVLAVDKSPDPKVKEAAANARAKADAAVYALILEFFHAPPAAAAAPPTGPAPTPAPAGGGAAEPGFVDRIIRRVEEALGGTPAAQPATATAPAAAAPAPPTQGPVDPQAAARIIQIGIAFRGSGNAPGAGVPTPDALALGTPGSVAAHGFFTLDPRLVAALTAPDGGNLTWLGATSGTRDSMHFELTNRPDLGYEAPN